MKGTIFDIKRFAVHDGPGIRSTLFLKGCPLRCVWCHNPEGISPVPELWYFSTKCMACRLCLDACLVKSLTVSNTDSFGIAINRETCTACGECVDICPTGALALDGREVNHQDILVDLLKDYAFFQESGGGVTLSGGDPVFQPDFALAVLEGLKEAGVHSALESALFCSSAVLQRFVPLVDLFLADFKLFSNNLHRRYTSVPNRSILENINFLLKSGKDVLIRIPLIPGYTAEDDNLTAIADYLKDFGAGVRCELLNYNPLTTNKYRLRGCETAGLEGLKPFSRERITAWEGLFSSRGIEVVSENKGVGRVGGMTAIKGMIARAERGEPVYINRVREAFAALPSEERCEIIVHLLLMDGKNHRCFTFSVPRYGDSPRVNRLVSDYLAGEVYNILSALGGRKITFYLDTKNSTLAALADGVIRSFYLDAPRRKRRAYGRCINVIDRMLSAMEGGAPSFAMEIADAEYRPDVADYREELRVEEGVFSRSVEALGAKRILGIDVGGTDIKIALAGEGKILCMKEYDWFPALFKGSRQLVDPIVLLTRLMAVWQGVHLSDAGIPREKRELLDAAMGRGSGNSLILMACEALEPYLTGESLLFDGIGLCFPDVVVNDKVVGGEVYKTRGIRLNPEIDYEEDFRQLTDLNLTLAPFCKNPEAVSFANDGPMAAFTAAVERAASGESDSLKNGFLAHTLGTELGTGWVREDGSIPDIPLEVYNCIIDLGSYPEREFHADDLRSVNNFNTGLPGTLQKYASQSGVFRLALKYFPAERPDLLKELEQKGFVVKSEAPDRERLVVPSDNPDLRKPFLEHMMTLLEREDDEVNHQIWNEIGESLGVSWGETMQLLHPKTRKGILFGRLVKKAACFRAMEKGAGGVLPEIQFETADAGIAFTPLMKQLEADPEFTVAQFAQAVGAVYFAVDRLIRKSLI